MNVSSTIAHNEIDIFFVMSHDEIIRKVSSWATAVDIVSIKKNTEDLESFAQFYENYAEMHC